MHSYTPLLLIINHNVCFTLSLFLNLDVSLRSVTTPLRCGEIFKISFTQTYQWIHQCKIFENRLAAVEVTDKSLVSWYFDSQCSSKECVCVCDLKHIHTGKERQRRRNQHSTHVKDNSFCVFCRSIMSSVCCRTSCYVPATSEGSLLCHQPPSHTA